MQRYIFSKTIPAVQNQFRMLKRVIIMKCGFLLIPLSIALLSACGGGGDPGGNTNPGVPPVTSTLSGKVADKNGVAIP